MRRDPGPTERGAGLKVVVASDKFKGALTAAEACAAMAEGIREAAPEADVDLCPMADGGEGTAEALAAGGGTIVEHDVCGPLPGMKVAGRITVLDDRQTAVIDMASAAGFSLLDEAQRDPTRTTTYGVGELIRHAIDVGCHRVIVGLGGSATCDAGLGAAQALGLDLTLDSGKLDRPFTGGDLGRLRHVEVPILGPRAKVTCLCDVSNPLFGPTGAAFIFAPQKGATQAQVKQLDAGLRHAAKVCDRLESAREAGMGAAGGLGFGLSIATKAALEPGADACADACRLAERLQNAQLCLTGEGCFDDQSLSGKAVVGVAHKCAEAEVPCVVLAGEIGENLAAAFDMGVSAYHSIAPGPAARNDLMRRTPELLARSAAQVMRLLLAVGEWTTLRRERGGVSGPARL